MFSRSEKTFSSVEKTFINPPKAGLCRHFSVYFQFCMSFSFRAEHCPYVDPGFGPHNSGGDEETKSNRKVSQMNSINRNRHSGKIAVVVLALSAWLAIPFVTGDAQTAGGVPILVRTANLVSPTGSINPHGNAEYQLYANGHREIEVEIEDVNLAAGTPLDAVVDGNTIGQIILAADRRGRLKLRTEDGQNVPVTNDGSTVEVRNGGTLLVSGTLNGGGTNPTPTASPTSSPTASPTASPTGSPSPSPTGSPNESSLFAALTGGTVNGVLPSGFAEFEIHSSRTELEVRTRQVNLPIGTPLSVFVNNTAAGTMTLESGGEGRLRLRSDNGQTVPAVIAGSTIAIRSGSATILSGVFGGSTSPTPTPSPGGTPAPTLGRSFEANLTGAGMTPPVTTSATGEFKITLNAAETQATIFGEFHNLSSTQTGARIETTVGTTAVIHSFGAIGGTNGNFASVTINVTGADVQQLRTGLWSAVITSANHPNGEIRAQVRQRSGESDFDGDGSNDLAVFRPSNSVWYTQNGSGFSAQIFGGPADTLVSGDYDGDGKTDAAVFKNIGGLGIWQIKRSSDAGVTELQFGFATDVPVRGDFDGDGRFDIAVFRPSTGVWYVNRSDNTGFTIVQFGMDGDKPLPIDMDGDGRDDIAVFRPSTGVWYWLRSSDGHFNGAQFGMNGDIPVRADIDGDGRHDMTVFRPSNGIWYSIRSTDGGFQGAQFGMNGDVPVAGNYDNDGKSDIAVFRPSTGVWYILRSSDGAFQALYFGMSGDLPAAAQ